MLQGKAISLVCIVKRSIIYCVNFEYFLRKQISRGLISHFLYNSVLTSWDMLKLKSFKNVNLSNNINNLKLIFAHLH